MTRAVFFGDTPHRLAGSQRSLLAAVVAAQGGGLEPVMLFPGDGAAPDAFRAAGIRVRIVEGTQAFQTFGKVLLNMSALGQARVVGRELFPYARRLSAVIDAERAEVVHFNTARGAIMAGMAAHLAGRDLVLHVRGAPAIGRPLWAAAQALSGRLILVARALEQHVAASARPRSRVVYNGVVPATLIPREQANLAAHALGVPRHWLGGDVPVIVALSSLVPFKGLHHLVRAARLLRDAGVDLRFVLAGTGLGDRYEAWLRGLPAELGVGDRFAFIGFVDDVQVLLAACDALVLPSVERERLSFDGVTVEVHGNEGLPRSVLEAMAAGRAVVATDIAGVQEEVEGGRTGLLVPPGDVPALRDALTRIASDLAFRAAAGRAALEVARSRFSVAASGLGLLDVLREAAARRPVLTRLADAFHVARDSVSDA